MQNYYPVLKSKAGEFGALNKLSLKTKNRVSPIIEWVGEGVKVMEDVTELGERWLEDTHQILIDPYYNLNEIETETLFIRAFHKLVEQKTSVLPVLSISNPAWLISIAKESPKGIAIRCRANNLIRASIVKSIDSVLKITEKTVEETVLIFDAGTVKENSGHFVGTFNDCIDEVQRLGKFKSIVVTAGSFPANLGGIESNTQTHLTRYEWQIWKSLNHSSFTYPVSYSDYGIKHPELSVDQFEGTASLKYTTDDSFYIMKGVKASKSVLGNKQYSEHCKHMVQQSFYDGQYYSRGDTKIYECSLNDRNPGNATTWVEVGHNHHITKIVDLL